nr:hypothetical protein Iba_chr03fCG2070 [Ipomoea batatas]GME07445.1 hypothetical protein Iba_scaffold5974CG0010 [Ipomoea batatas]
MDPGREGVHISNYLSDLCIVNGVPLFFIEFEQAYGLRSSTTKICQLSLVRLHACKVISADHLLRQPPAMQRWNQAPLARSPAYHGKPSSSPSSYFSASCLPSILHSNMISSSACSRKG